MDPYLFQVDHPIVDHCLTLLRDRRTPPAEFRGLTQRLTRVLLLEATRDLEVKQKVIETPLETMGGKVLRRRVAVIPILRAGLGMLEPALELFPDAAVGYLGLERDEETAEARSYYEKLPPLARKDVLIVDPMLATGGTMESSLEVVCSRSPASVRIVSIVAAPEGVTLLRKHYPETPIWVASLDRELNSKKYILPGLGDFGDRLFNT